MTAPLVPAAPAALSDSLPSAPSSSDPAGSDPSVARPARRRPKLVDWRRAARLLADGSSPEEIAATVGIDEAHFWRHLRNSLRFQFYVRQARDRRRLLGRLQLELVAGDAVLRGLRNAERLDRDMLAWATATAGLQDGAVDESDTDLIAQLGATGRMKTGRMKRAPQPAVVGQGDAAEPTVETKRHEAPRAAGGIVQPFSPPPLAAMAPPWGGMAAGAASGPRGDAPPDPLKVRHLG
jgi:hypothetical protein